MGIITQCIYWMIRTPKHVRLYYYLRIAYVRAYVLVLVYLAQSAIFPQN